MTVNKVTLVGNLGADPELKVNGDQKQPICTFRLATNERGSDATKQYTEWHNLVAFGNVATLCSKYLKKGNQVYLEGRLRTSEYKDNGGIQRRSTRIVVSTVKFLNNNRSLSSESEVEISSNGSSEMGDQSSEFV